MKSSYSCCRKVESFTAQQKVLLHNRKLYYVTEIVIAQQKVLLHSRKFYCTAKSFTAQQKVLPHSRKVNPVTKTREKFLLREKQKISPLCSVFPWT